MPAYYFIRLKTINPAYFDDLKNQPRETDNVNLSFVTSEINLFEIKVINKYVDCYNIYQIYANDKNHLLELVLKNKHLYRLFFAFQIRGKSCNKCIECKRVINKSHDYAILHRNTNFVGSCPYVTYEYESSRGNIADNLSEVLDQMARNYPIYGFDIDNLIQSTQFRSNVSETAVMRRFDYIQDVYNFIKSNHYYLYNKKIRQSRIKQMYKLVTINKYDIQFVLRRKLNHTSFLSNPLFDKNILKLIGEYT